MSKSVAARRRPFGGAESVRYRLTVVALLVSATLLFAAGLPGNCQDPEASEEQEPAKVVSATELLSRCGFTPSDFEYELVHTDPIAELLGRPTQPVVSVRFLPSDPGGYPLVVTTDPIKAVTWVEPESGFNDWQKSVIAIARRAVEQRWPKWFTKPTVVRVRECNGVLDVGFLHRVPEGVLGSEATARIRRHDLAVIPAR